MSTETNEPEGDESRPRKRSKGKRRSDAERGEAREDRAPADRDAERMTRLERAGVLAALEAGISEALPGVEILDRDLVFDTAHADLAAVDPVGRLVLVLVAGEDTDRAALDALDLCAYARANAGLLVRHIGSRRLDPSIEPRVVAIDPDGDVRLAERLGAIAAAGIEIFAVQTVASAAGERSYLVATGPEARAALQDGGGVDTFLDALPLPLQEIGRELTSRMARLDDELFATADQHALVWRWNGEILARFECEGERLTASVAPNHAPSPVRRAEDIDDVLEEALARLVAEFTPRVPVRGELPGAPERELRDGPPRPVAGDLSPDEPILSQEERDAFFA